MLLHLHTFSKLLWMWLMLFCDFLSKRFLFSHTKMESSVKHFVVKSKQLSPHIVFHTFTHVSKATETSHLQILKLTKTYTHAHMIVDREYNTCRIFGVDSEQLSLQLATIHDLFDCINSMNLSENEVNSYARTNHRTMYMWRRIRADFERKENMRTKCTNFEFSSKTTM